MKIKPIINIASVFNLRSGIGRYTLELVNALIRRNEMELSYFDGYKVLQNLPILNPNNKKKFNFKNYIKKILKKSKFKNLYDLNYYIRSTLFKTSSYRKSTNLYHEPNYISYKYDGLKVVNVHDLSWIHFPDAHPQERVNFLNKRIERSMKDANLIITDTEFIKKDIINFFPETKNKIQNIYLGVSDDFKLRNSSDVNKTLNKYNLKFKKFFLFVSTIEPRKNLINILNAYNICPKKIKDQYPLIICGSNGWLSKDILEHINSLSKNNDIRRIGFIDDSDLFNLYSSCHTFLYPSLYEGFGLPVLEAMKSGAPVITSENSAMSEISNGSSLLVNPLNIEQISTNIIQLVENKELYENFVKKGLNNCKKFSWDKTAKELTDSYNTI